MKFPEGPKGLLTSLLEGLNTPRSLGIALRLENDIFDDWLSIHPSDYNDWLDYAKDAQAYAFIAKNESIIPKELLERHEREAISDFFKIEEANERNNLAFCETLKNNEQFLSKAQAIVKQLIKNQPTDSFYDVTLPTFGPGATSVCSGRDTTYIDKLAATPECTESCLDILLFKNRGSIYQEHVQNYEVIPGNYFFTVPKNFKVRRACCKEPHLNTWLQRSLGLSLKSRLKKSGYELESIPDLHKYKLFHEGSRYSTLDLKQASDRIYYQLVKYLVPPVWFDFLNRTRSHYTYIDNKWHKNHKFSSMGNGFTFELETIIFLALARSVARFPNEVTVFGDDILCHVEDGAEVQRFLTSLGLIVNSDKTFLDGVFKESCGADLWSGINVRPIYLKVLPSDRKNEDPEIRVRFANSLRRITLRLFGQEERYGPFTRQYHSAVRGIPNEFRITGPDPFYREDLFLEVPVFLQESVEFLDNLYKVELGSRPVARPCDSDGWLHCTSDKAARYRLTKTFDSRWRKKPRRYKTIYQIINALAGQDPGGSLPRDTPYWIEKIENNNIF